VTSAQNKSKGYGIVSLLDGCDFARLWREMNGKYMGTVGTAAQQGQAG